jgi:hypothetical protein
MGRMQGNEDERRTLSAELRMEYVGEPGVPCFTSIRHPTFSVRCSFEFSAAKIGRFCPMTLQKLRGRVLSVSAFMGRTGASRQDDTVL